MKSLLLLAVSTAATALLCLTVLYVGRLNPLEAFLLLPVGILGVLFAIDAV